PQSDVFKTLVFFKFRVVVGQRQEVIIQIKDETSSSLSAIRYELQNLGERVQRHPMRDYDVGLEMLKIIQAYEPHLKPFADDLLRQREKHAQISTSIWRSVIKRL